MIAGPHVGGFLRPCQPKGQQPLIGQGAEGNNASRRFHLLSRILFFFLLPPILIFLHSLRRDMLILWTKIPLVCMFRHALSCQICSGGVTTEHEQTLKWSKSASSNTRNIVDESNKYQQFLLFFFFPPPCEKCSISTALIATYFWREQHIKDVKLS